MHVKRYHDAKPYDAPNHRGVVGLRLQGFEPQGPTNHWVGISHFLPGGGAGPDSTPFEKVYVVIEGEISVIVGGEEVVLRRFDSCTIAPNEERELINRSNDPCSMVVAIPYPPGYSHE
jgi:mannose-6-phosphate isomerase-like protein (cupin superfamily)